MTLNLRHFFILLVLSGFLINPLTLFPYGVEKSTWVSEDSISAGDVEKLVMVSGAVKDKKTQEPLGWTNVIIQGTTEGIMADNSGNYTMKVPRGSTLVYSFVGFVTERVRIFNGGVYDVTLSPVIFRINLPDVSEEMVITSKRTKSPKRRVKNTDGEMVAIEEMPNFTYGGFTGLAVFIKEKTQIYVDETDQRGWVKLAFTITSSGKAVDPYVIQSNNDNLDHVAMDIIKGLHGWMPGRQRGVAVDVKVSLEMKFE